MAACKNNKGFTLVEVMIVVAIIGILATVCVPLYMSYIQRSRVRTFVYPGLHIIESNMGLYYATTGHLPGPTLLTDMMLEADTTFFNVGLNGDELVITIDSEPPGSKLSRLDDMVLILKPNTDSLKLRTWSLSGSLAKYLGISDSL